tara:strand:+ start:400 stop:1719 length:1320 start_codon:yes stop_codon:yes gene_type:complete
MRTTGALFFSFLISCSFNAHSQNQDELMDAGATLNLQQIFEVANFFTVQIFAQVKYAFGSNEEGTSSGAGFLIDKKKGWVLTNAHVAQHSPGPLDVAFKEDTFHSAERIYVDPYFDIAIIGVDPNVIPQTANAAELDCNHGRKIGLEVAAFGHPWGLRFTATRGIVSAYRYTEGYEQLQTDAALNAGNSGGALVDLTTGKVIGINTAKLSKKEKKAEGLNFAVPISHVCPIINILKNGKSPLPPRIEAAFGRRLTTDAVFVARDGTDGWTSLKSGDQITSVENGVLIKNPAELITALRGKTGKITLTIIRKGITQKVDIQVTPARSILGNYGIDVGGILFATPRRVGATGALDGFYSYVANIQDGSTGSICGAQTWDLLISVDDRLIRSVDDLYAYLTRPGAEKKAKFVVRRWSRSSYLRVEHFVLDCSFQEIKRIVVK